MLEYIHLINFQKHKDFTQHFTEKTTYITGVNGCGKSTVLRALMWVACNQGDSKSFIRTYEEDGSVCTSKEVSAEVGIDGHIVKRVYSSSKNEYYVDGLKITGFGKSVPEEVANIFKMSDLNYSEQFSSLFLLNDSGNSLATELGEVASLEEMDELSDAVNASIRTKNAEVESIEEACNESSKKIENVGNLPSVLETMDDEIRKMISEYKDKDREIKELQDIRDTLSEKKDLTYLKDKLDNTEPEASLFNDDVYLSDLIIISTKLKELPPIPQTIIDNLDFNIEESEFYVEDVSYLENILNQVRNIDKENADDKTELNSIDNQLNEFKVCPFCGSQTGEHKCQN